MNKFEKYFLQLRELENSMDNAIDETEKENIRSEYHEFCNDINSNGKTFAEIMKEYERSRKLGNVILDFHHLYNASNVVETLAENGVYEFTYSAPSTDVVENCYELSSHGATLTGMTTVCISENIHGEKEISPAIKFSLVK